MVFRAVRKQKIRDTADSCRNSGRNKQSTTSSTSGSTTGKPMDGMSNPCDYIWPGSSPLLEGLLHEEDTLFARL